MLGLENAAEAQRRSDIVLREAVTGLAVRRPKRSEDQNDSE